MILLMRIIMPQVNKIAIPVNDSEKIKKYTNHIIVNAKIDFNFLLKSGSLKIKNSKKKISRQIFNEKRMCDTKSEI